MADQKITELTAIGANVDPVDLVAIVDDPSGSPATKKATKSELLGGGFGCVFRALGTTVTTLVKDVWTTVIFNSETFDIGSNYSTATGLFTAPANGYYQFNAGVMVDSIVAGKRFVIALVIGSTNTTQAGIQTVAGKEGASVSDVFYLTAAQTVSVKAYHNDTANRDTDTGNEYTWFSGIRLA